MFFPHIYTRTTNSILYVTKMQNELFNSYEVPQGLLDEVYTKFDHYFPNISSLPIVSFTKFDDFET